MSGVQNKMTMTCPSCNQKVKRGHDDIQCSAESCMQVYHTACIKDVVEVESVKCWKCPKCVSVKCTSENIIGDHEKATVSANSLEDIKVQLTALAQSYTTIIKQLADLTDVVTKYEQSMTDLANKCIEKDKKIEELKNDVQTQDVKIQSLESQIDNFAENLKKKEELVDNLESRLIQQEQYSRKNHFEIRELKEKPGESVCNIVLKLAKELNVPLAAHDIQAAHRLRAWPGKTPAIIVNLKDRKSRDLIVQSRKIVSSSTLIGDEGNRIYIGASLSPHYRQLLRDVRMKIKSDVLKPRYKRCWWAGVVKVEKFDGEILKLEKFSDISSIN